MTSQPAIENEHLNSAEVLEAADRFRAANVNLEKSDNERYEAVVELSLSKVKTPAQTAAVVGFRVLFPKGWTGTQTEADQRWESYRRSVIRVASNARLGVLSLGLSLTPAAVLATIPLMGGLSVISGCVAVAGMLGTGAAVRSVNQEAREETEELDQTRSNWMRTTFPTDHQKKVLLDKQLWSDENLQAFKELHDKARSNALDAAYQLLAAHGFPDDLNLDNEAQVLKRGADIAKQVLQNASNIDKTLDSSVTPLVGQERSIEIG